MEHLTIDPAYVFSSLVGLVVWFTRLESKVSRTEKDVDKQDKLIAKMSEKHDTLEGELIRDLNEVKNTLARIEGRFLKGE